MGIREKLSRPLLRPRFPLLSQERGCLSVVIDVTASIIEIQWSDPFFRSDKLQADLHSEQMLAMSDCTALVRLVNCVIEKTRKRSGISNAVAADAIGIPRRLIDVRHEGSHRDLPTLAIVRDSSDVFQALNWLKSYYWEPQKKQIPFQKDGAVNIRREIKSKLSELAFCIKVNQDPELGSLLVSGKVACEVADSSNTFVAAVNFSHLWQARCIHPNLQVLRNRLPKP